MRVVESVIDGELNPLVLSLSKEGVGKLVRKDK